MTQVVTVHTDFTDLNQMAQGLVGRVDPTRVILPGPEPVDVGEWVQFAVTLQDGSPGFAGVGRCIDAVDNGDERSMHQRFDVVIDSLQFDTRGQQIFEHILVISGYTGEEQPQAEEAYAEEGAYPEESTGEPEAYAAEEASGQDEFESEFTGSALEVPEDALSEVMQADSVEPVADEAEEDLSEATMVAESPVDFSESLSAASFDEEDKPTAPPPAGAFVPEDALTAPPPPQALIARQVSAQSNGAISFAYPDGLPFPSAPPRPDLAAEQRVTRAPRPKA